MTETIVPRQPLDAVDLDLVFREARTYSAWLPKPVPEGLLRELYDLVKFGPTAINACPLRIVYVTSPQGKERILPAMAEGNVEKTRTAPVTAILAYDSAFYEYLPTLFPMRDLRASFAENPERAKATAELNAALQMGYFFVAARSLGLDCGPMAGFDAEALNGEFFPDGRWRVLVVCNLGYGDATKLHPRLPRLDFETACRIV